MAVRINREELTSSHINNIRKHLCMQPKSGYYSSSGYADMASKEPVLFYLIENDDVIVPYTFGAALTQKIPNHEKSYPRKNFNFTGKLRETQEEVAVEAMAQLSSHGTTLLALHPGFGKTVLASYLASKLGYLTLVLYHRTILEPQWLNTFSNHTDSKVWVVGTNDDNIDINKVDVILSMDTQFWKIKTEYRELIGCLIVDEGHAFCTPSHVECLLGTTPRHIIIATATPDRDDGMHSMIRSMIGLHGVYRKSTKRHIVLRLQTGIKPIIHQNAKGDMDWGKVVNDLCNDPIRNGYVLGLVKNNPEFKICILTWRKEHAFNLHQWLTDMGEKAAVMAGKTKTYSDSRVLVGTVSKIGTGFDEQNACLDFAGERINMLILLGTTKSEQLLEQTLGRAFRADLPHIIVFTDDVPAIKRHWTIIKKWCISHNGEIYEVKAPTCHQNDHQAPSQTQINNLLKSQLSSLTS